MRNSVFDFAVSTLSDFVWLVYDSAKAIASVLSNNLNLHGPLRFLEKYQNFVADAIELLEALMRALAHFTN